VREAVHDRGIEDKIFLDRRWGARGYNNGRMGMICIDTWAWKVPGITVAVEYLKDSGSGIGKVLLIYIVNSQPGHDRDLGESGGGDNSGLRRSERHLKQLASL